MVSCLAACASQVDWKGLKVEADPVHSNGYRLSLDQDEFIVMLQEAKDLSGSTERERIQLAAARYAQRQLHARGLCLNGFTEPIQVYGSNDPFVRRIDVSCAP
jgi:hypothetical protein